MMTTKRKHSSDKDDEKTPSKRPRASQENITDSNDEDCMPRRRGRSQTRQIRRRKTPPGPPVPSTPVVHIMSSNEESSDGEDEDTKAYEPIERIRTAISYTRAQIRKGLHPNQTTRFKIPLSTSTSHQPQEKSQRLSFCAPALPLPSSLLRTPRCRAGRRSEEAGSWTSYARRLIGLSCRILETTSQPAHSINTDDTSSWKTSTIHYHLHHHAKAQRVAPGSQIILRMLNDTPSRMAPRARVLRTKPSPEAPQAHQSSPTPPQTRSIFRLLPSTTP